MSLATIFLLFFNSTLTFQSVMDLLSAIFFVFVVTVWYKKKAEIHLSGEGEGQFQLFQPMGFEWGFLAWLLIVAIGFLVAPNPPLSPPPLFGITRFLEFRWILLFYLIIAVLKAVDLRTSQFRWFQWSILATSSISLIDYVIRILKPNTPPGYRLEGLYQFSMTHAHVYGPYFALLLGVFLGNFQQWRWKRNLLFAITLFTVGLSVLLTFTRGVWIALFLAVVMVGFIWNFRKGLMILAGGLITAGALYLAIPSIKHRVDFTLLMLKPNTTRSETYDTERAVLWRSNLMIFKDHLLFGVGYGQNKYWLRSYYDKQGLPSDQFVSHAHNQYIHFLAGTGLLGFLCYLAFLGSNLWMAFIAYRRTPPSDSWHRGLALGALGAQLCLILGGLTESNFEHSKVRYAGCFIWGIGVWLYQRQKKLGNAN